jgi:O-acetyl-ADP-ribose deacetylase (regulator of RNase III)
MSSAEVTLVDGDIIDQPVVAIVNSWNRNIIPWWLLLPQGVSGAIKRRAGLEPFRELGRAGPMKLGSAVLTSAGQLPYRAIIHVAGINMWWRASEYSVRESTRNALLLARQHGLESLAFPLIGTGSGGFSHERALRLMREEIGKFPSSPSVIRIVRFR